MSVQNIADVLTAAALLALALSHWKLRGRVTMLEAAAALRGNVQAYGARTPGDREGRRQ